MNQLIIAQQVERQTNISPDSETTYFWEGVGVAIIIVLLLIVWSGQMTGKIAHARFSNIWDKRNATKKAEKQMAERRPNKVTLYCGYPYSRGIEANFSTILGEMPTRYVCDAQRSCLLMGFPESGKSYSTIDPLIRSAIEQGFPVICYDSQEVQIATHAAYAAEQGYEVFAFAPGKKYSGVINILDFVEDSGDKLKAQQLAQVINRNSDPDPSAKKDKFFFSAADGVVQMALMLAKDSGYPDIVQAYQILALPSLTQRILEASRAGHLNPWIAMAAATLSTAADAPETVSGILSTATTTFRNIIDREFIGCLCGQSTIPKRLEGKQILFLVLDQKTAEVMSPLIAAILHILMLENFSYQRDYPLIVSLDELPTLYLPSLVEWINTLRKKGFCGLLGVQNLAQLEMRYGKAAAEAIIGACGTKAIFNPQHGPSAEQFSKYFGEREKRIKTTSTSRGTRQMQSSRAEQYHKVPLISAERLLTLPSGHCAFTNPGYASGDRANLPILGKIAIPKRDRRIAARSEAMWPQIAERMAENMEDKRLKADDELLKGQLLDRQTMAECVLPEAFPQEAIDDELEIHSAVTGGVYATE